MSQTRIPEDDPNFENFYQEAELPYEEFGETTDVEIYKLNGSSGVAVYRAFQMEGQLPGTNVKSDQLYGLEVERMSDGRDHAMLVRPENDSNVFEYRNGSIQPEDVLDIGGIGPLRNFRVKEMLTPDT